MEVIDIKNIQFEKGGTRILLVSQKVLNGVVDMLNYHPSMKIQFNLSDNTNAKQRAKAIYKYFIAHGTINPMSYKGTTDPAANETILQLLIIQP